MRRSPMPNDISRGRAQNALSLDLGGIRIGGAGAVLHPGPTRLNPAPILFDAPLVLPDAPPILLDGGRKHRKAEQGEGTDE